MRKTVLYGVFAFCLLLMSSCLGDPATNFTISNAAGVVRIDGGKLDKKVYVKGGQVVSSDDFQKANVENNECILFDYSIDYSSGENTGKGDSAVMTATIYENTIKEVNQWVLFNTLTDTSIVVPKELTLSTLQKRFDYIQGRLFLFAEMSNHKTNQLDSFSLSYNPNEVLGADRVYNLYLRTILQETDTTAGKSMIIPCAFDIQSLVNSASGQGGDTKEVNFRINYVTGFQKDTTACVFTASDVFTINLSDTGN